MDLLNIVDNLGPLLVFLAVLVGLYFIVKGLIE